MSYRNASILYTQKWFSVKEAFMTMGLPEGQYKHMEAHTTIQLRTDDGTQIEKYNPDDPFHDATINPTYYSVYLQVETEDTKTDRWVWLMDAGYPLVAKMAMMNIAQLFQCPFTDNIEEV